MKTIVTLWLSIPVVIISACTPAVQISAQNIYMQAKEDSPVVKMECQTKPTGGIITELLGLAAAIFW